MLAPDAIVCPLASFAFWRQIHSKYAAWKGCLWQRGAVKLLTSRPPHSTTSIRRSGNTLGINPLQVDPCPSSEIRGEAVHVFSLRLFKQSPPTALHLALLFGMCLQAWRFLLWVLLSAWPGGGRGGRCSTLIALILAVQCLCRYYFGRDWALRQLQSSWMRIGMRIIRKK